MHGHENPSSVKYLSFFVSQFTLILLCSKLDQKTSTYHPEMYEGSRFDNVMKCQRAFRSCHLDLILSHGSSSLHNINAWGRAGYGKNIPYRYQLVPSTVDLTLFDFGLCRERTGMASGIGYPEFLPFCLSRHRSVVA